MPAGTYSNILKKPQYNFFNLNLSDRTGNITKPGSYFIHRVVYKRTMHW
jgi:hypothetical protein